MTDQERQDDDRPRGPPPKKQHGFLRRVTVDNIERWTRPGWHRGMSQEEWRRKRLQS